MRLDRRTIVAALILGWAAQARKPEPLPEFSLTGEDGKSVSSSQLRLPDHWLLFYVHRNSRHSETVLNALKDEKPGSLKQKAVVIVGGAAGTDLASMAKAYPHLTSVSWYADPKWQALRALKLRGSPAVVGIRHGAVQWNLTGTLAKQDHLKSILKSWKNKTK